MGTESWYCAGQCVAGIAHVQAGLPCQDHMACNKEGTRRRVVAIADGAGSAKHGEIGAKLAVDVIVAAISQHTGSLKDITEAQAIEFGQQVRSQLAEKCDEDGGEISDYSCTLLAAAFEDQWSYFWHLGDGGWIVETPKRIECATKPFKGEFANQTAFITSEDWHVNNDQEEPKWKDAIYEDVIAAIAFTDGLEMFCLEPSMKAPQIPFVEKIFSALKGEPSETEVASKIEHLLTSSIVREREDDDLTMVLVWKGSSHDPAG